MTPEAQMVISFGSLLSVFGLFYQWHKDSKETARKIQKMETEIEQLKEHKAEIRDIKTEIAEIKHDLNSFNQVMTRIDTNVSHIMQTNN